MSKSQQAEVKSSATRLVHFTCRALFFLLLGASAAQAQTAPDPENYPNKTIRYVVPYPPGGFNDTLGRIFAQKLSEAWGVPVVVENRPGGGTLIGTDSVAKAAPDGYTLLGVAFPFGANPSIYKSLPYDTMKDLTPVIFAGQTQNLLVVRPSMPIHSVQEFIDHARKNPGKVSYGSTGIGSSTSIRRSTTRRTCCRRSMPANCARSASQARCAQRSRQAFRPCRRPAFPATKSPCGSASSGQPGCGRRSSVN
jgi:hypothetical protein